MSGLDKSIIHSTTKVVLQLGLIVADLACPACRYVTTNPDKIIQI